ncbi:hypothetical protein HYH03_000336 [Edaphochlamys debaryana]|uniref:Tryptophan synthase beta chain-like PALP domain-containing protein n=1 Tax=Edaphochlamys debaryana TaxID=47281 RepID=A0A836C739_9CHLO|nr:hypothetical protein HYH03_000336 [Edaphochlamys debaryana]|eukprot:KAG2501838.1 hypothetical protein HYH03_000336 [Edaphochlamys debaryana]
MPGLPHRSEVPSLRTGSSPSSALNRVGAFLSRRRWLRPTPDTPVQWVQPRPPVTTPGGGRDVLLDGFSAGGGAGGSGTGFYLLRDDLLHPVLGGNKVRKLDALLPELVDQGATHLVTCGGAQSAHLAAVAVAGAELGLRTHLLVRGEAPKIPSGYHLVTRMYGSEVLYVTRSEYAVREAMLATRVEALRRAQPEAQVAVIPEGGGQPSALLGLIRLAHCLAATGAGPEAAAAVGQPGAAASPLGVAGRQAPLQGGGGAGPGRGPQPPVVGLPGLPAPLTTPYRIVVDSGTGTAAIGLALGVAVLGLPWTVLGIMLAGDLPYYQSQQEQLVRGFMDLYGRELYGEDLGCSDLISSDAAAGTGAPESGFGAAPRLPLRWLPRRVPRSFGKVLPGEVEACRQVARWCGVGLDPIYSLAAWELCCGGAEGGGGGQEGAGAGAPAASVGTSRAPMESGRAEAKGEHGGDGRDAGGGSSQGEGPLVMLHGGGALGLHGLAQRYPDRF